MSKLHIGSRIKEILNRRKMSVIELSDILSMTRQNVDKIFKKDAINTDLLFTISKCLKFDFFRFYSDELNKKEDVPVDPTDYTIGTNALTETRKELTNCLEKFKLQTENTVSQQKLIKALEDRLDSLTK